MLVEGRKRASSHSRRESTFADLRRGSVRGVGGLRKGEFGYRLTLGAGRVLGRALGSCSVGNPRRGLAARLLGCQSAELAVCLQTSDKGNIHTYDVKQVKGGTFHKEITSASFTGKKTLTITLTKGKWEFCCAVHPTQMFGFFTVN
jgi:hypothetical protein